MMVIWTNGVYEMIELLRQTAYVKPRDKRTVYICDSILHLKAYR
jgi:hypothetical protein